MKAMMMGRRNFVVCGLALSLLGSAIPGYGLQGESTAPLSPMERVELMLAEARAIAEQASDPEVSASAAVRMVDDAMRTAETAVRLTQEVGVSAEELVAAQALRRQGRDFLDGLRLVDETRYAARVHAELADLQDRIAALRPECGVPGFSADWQSNLAQIARRLEELHRGDMDLASARANIDGHLEALHLSVDAHEGLSTDLCSLHDTYAGDHPEREAAILNGRRLGFVISSFEEQERRARTMPGEVCAPSGYLRVVPSSRVGSLVSYRPSVGSESWPAHAEAFVLDHLVVGAEGPEVELPTATTVHTRRTENTYSTCGSHPRQRGLGKSTPVRVTRVVEHVVEGRYAVVLQTVGNALSRHSEADPGTAASPVTRYLTGIRAAIGRLAASDAGRNLSESDFVAEYGARFGRLEWVGRRLAQDVRVLRMMAGDIHGDDRANYWVLYGEHSRAYDAVQQTAVMTAAQLKLAREANQSRLNEAKVAAAAHVEAAQVQAEGLVRATREQARASRFGTWFGSLTGLVGRFVPTTMLHGLIGSI